MERHQERKQSYWNKNLHEKFRSAAETVTSNRSWESLMKIGLKKETEEFLMVAQEQALRTPNIRNK